MGIKNLVNNSKLLIYRYKEHEVDALAAQITYYLILSFFPFLIILISLLGYTPLSNEEVLRNISYLLPANTQQMVIDIALEVTSNNNEQLLSLGMLTTLWIASKGGAALIKGINKAFGQREIRSFWNIRIRSFVFMIGLALVLIISLLLLIFGKVLGELFFNFLGISQLFMLIWFVLRFLIPISSMIIVFLIIYKYMPYCHLKFKEALPGAVFASLGWILSSLAFAFYVNNFGNFTKVYGSIGGIIVLLTWLYLSSIIILLGGEINAMLKSDATNNCNK